MRFSSAFWSWQSYKEFNVRASVFVSCFSTCGVAEKTFSPSLPPFSDKKRVSFYWIWWHIHEQNESEASFFGGKFIIFSLARLVMALEKWRELSRLLRFRAQAIVPRIKEPSWLLCFFFTWTWCMTLMIIDIILALFCSRHCLHFEYRFSPT